MMGYIGRVLFTHLDDLASELGVAIVLLIAILVSVVIYVVLLGFLRVIHQNNIVKIPLIGKMLARLFP